MDKKSVLLVFLGYVIWGLQPLYWDLMGHMDPMLNLCFRILWAVVFSISILAVTKRLPELTAVFKNKQKMKFLVPATLFLLLDWGIFIYAVQTGHVLDTSLGYYMAPFVVFALGMLVFKEQPKPLILVAIGLAVIGVVFSAIQYGSIPVISLVLSFLFAVYGALKKFAQVESVVSIAAETIMMAPLAILFLLFFRMEGLAATSVSDHLLFIGSGVVTALPMMLYSLGVIKLPFVMLGFMQYISPTLSLLCGLLMGERVTQDKLVTFLFIWAALAVYMFAMVMEERKKKALQNATTEITR